tara:strand:+ start:277 stop:543 length:267 start_codon:yes stop_codon:yes gene_type:complete
MRSILFALFAYGFYMLFLYDDVYDYYLNKPHTFSSTMIENTAQAYCDELGDFTVSMRPSMARSLVKYGMEKQGDIILRSKEICPRYWK